MNARPDARIVLPSTALAPRGGTVHSPSAGRLAHQWAAAVSLTSINDVAIRSPALPTDHRREDEAVVVASIRTVGVAQNCDFTFLEHIRFGPTCVKISPSRNRAGGPRCHIVARGREAHCAHAVIELHGGLKPDEGPVVLHSAGTVLWMSEQLRSPPSLLVAARLVWLVLASDDVEIGSAHAVRRGEHPLRMNELPSTPRDGSLITLPPQAHLPIPLAFCRWMAIYDRRIGTAGQR